LYDHSINGFKKARRGMARALKVAVVGAGMGGLSLGCALRARGIEVQLYDQAGELTQVGAGIQLTPNATKALRGLGLEHRLKEFGFLPQATVGRDWKTGRQVFRTPLLGACEPLYNAHYVHIHRADLQRILYEALPPGIVHLSQRCTGVRNEGSAAVATFAGGREVEADLVVAADGIRSAVRSVLFGDGAPRFTGHICWRSVVQLGAPDYELVSPDNSVWFGPHGHIVTYYVNGGKAVNVVAILESDTWAEESWTVRSTKEELSAAYPGWNEKLHRLFARAGEVYKWGLFDREPMKSWTLGRVTLLGDAAHPMLPYLSQGAAMAMEDSVVLGRTLGEHGDDVAAALKMYEAIRIPRTTRVVLTSRAQGNKNHLVSPWARFWRDVGYRVRNLINPQHTGLKAAWVYEYDPTAAPGAGAGR
jgi:salicylate hydroxylase